MRGLAMLGMAEQDPAGASTVREQAPPAEGSNEGTDGAGSGVRTSRVKWIARTGKISASRREQGHVLHI